MNTRKRLPCYFGNNPATFGESPACPARATGKLRVMNPLPTVIAAAAQSTPTSAAIGPAVIVAVAIIVIWRFAVFRNGKGTPAGRILAVLLALAVAWVLLAVAQPTAATRTAAGTASGVAMLLAASARILSAV